MRWWAFWRRTQYILGICAVFLIIGGGVYAAYFYQTPTCFDGNQNADERGVDCGGSCLRICAFDVLPLRVIWSEAFRIADSQYNAVAYIENKNLNAGSPEVRYTFNFYDDNGLITERSGVTVLPPDSVYPIFEGRIDTKGREVTRTTIDVEEAATWLPAEIGREQFVIENRELRNADSKPRLDAAITNTALTNSKDVEVVATIFDIRGNALTASRTIVPEFEARTTRDVVFTWPEPIAKTLRSCEVPTDVVLAIDLSGSMNNDGGVPPEPITSVLSAAEAFVDRLNPEDQVAIVTYATNAKVQRELTSDVETVKSTVSNLRIDPKEETGSTNTGDALLFGNEELTSVRHNLDARKVLILLTDGLANAPDEDPEGHALRAGTLLKESGTELYVIGLGDTVNEEFLSALASGREHYFRAAEVDTLDTIYRSITAAICEDGAAVIEIVPKAKTSFEALK